MRIPVFDGDSNSICTFLLLKEATFAFTGGLQREIFEGVLVLLYE